MKPLIEKIKVGYDPQTLLYTIKLPNLYGINNLSVNGRPLLDPMLGFNQGNLVITSIKPTNITYNKDKTNHVGWLNTENDFIMSVEAYQEIVSSFNRTFCDHTEEWKYANIEAEIKATIFIRNHSKKYAVESETISLEIEMIKYPASKYKEIIPLYSMDANNVFETKCMYTPDLMGLLMECLLSHGVTSDYIKIPTHSGIRYVQENDKYITGIEDFQKRHDKSFIGMYSECVSKMEDVKEKLINIVDFHFNKQSNNILNKATVGSLITSLNILQNSIYCLDVKVKDENAKRALNIRINELVTVYQKLA
jgi:hypothetical protein